MRYEIAVSLPLLLSISCGGETKPVRDASQVRTEPQQAVTSTPPPVIANREPSTTEAVPPSQEGAAANANPEPTAGKFGTPDPISVAAASDAHRWVVACQARQDTNGDQTLDVAVTPEGEVSGDALDWYYLEAGGTADMVIDQFAGADYQGRFVALVQKQRLLLRDSELHGQVDLSALGAVAEDDAAPYRSHRALSFAPDAPRVAYLRNIAGQQTLVVRELLSGAEREYDVGRDLISRIQLRAGQRWLQLSVIEVDSNRNRRLDWSYPRQRGKKRCPLPIPTYDVWSYPGDIPTTRLLDLQTGTVTPQPEFVTTLGDGFVTRSSSGELWFQRGEQRRKLSSDKCVGRIGLADTTTQSLVFGCAEKSGLRRQMYLQLTSGRRDLGFDIAAFELDASDRAEPRLLALYPHDDTFLIDLVTGDQFKLTETSRVLATFEQSALVERAGKLYFVRIVNRAAVETASPHRRPSLEPILRAASFVALGRDVYDLKDLKFVGTFQSAPLALSPDGRALVASADSDGVHLSRGPLTWITATP